MFRENRFILRNGQPPSIILRPRGAAFLPPDNLEQENQDIIPADIVQDDVPAGDLPVLQDAGGIVANLGVLPPLPNVPPVSVYYRGEEEFEWGPGRDRILRTGGPGGQNRLLTPLINKVSFY